MTESCRTHAKTCLSDGPGAAIRFVDDPGAVPLLIAESSVTTGTSVLFDTSVELGNGASFTAGAADDSGTSGVLLHPLYD